MSAMHDEWGIRDYRAELGPTALDHDVPNTRESAEMAAAEGLEMFGIEFVVIKRSVSEWEDA